MAKKHLQKLELTWIGKGEEPKLEPRILIENPEYSYWQGREKGKPAPWTKIKSNISEIQQSAPFCDSDNILIHGDNLLALKALEQEYASKIKCVCIDPPYNTGAAFEHYDDGVEHSLWLDLISIRLKIIRDLLSEDGSIWITIDDNEAHYLKILCDEVFGRKNFVASVIWEKAYSERMDAKGFSSSHDYILVYRKSEKFKPLQLEKEQNKKQFNFFDSEKNKYYRRRSLRKEGSESLRTDRPSMWFPIEAPDGELIYPYKPDGIEGRWRWKQDNVMSHYDELEFIKKDNKKWEIYVKQFIDENATRPPSTLWRQEEVGHNHEAKEEVKAFNRKDVFETPKPERLIQKILLISSSENDLILDSFLGSGTTAAVAHKMGRRWIGVELGEHAITHCVPRLKAVVDGEQGGISKAVNWQGGGGFKFYTLAPSLLKKDKFGNWIISEEYNADMLAAAMAKQEGFIYKPSNTQYWKQGQSSEQDFIFTTTQFLTVEALDRIHDDMQPGESLLICCKSFHKGCGSKYANITVKKIPQLLLNRCEFGKEDYSLNIINLPTDESESEEKVEVKIDNVPVQEINAKTKKSNKNRPPELF